MDTTKYNILDRGSYLHEADESDDVDVAQSFQRSHLTFGGVQRVSIVGRCPWGWCSRGSQPACMDKRARLCKAVSNRRWILSPTLSYEFFKSRISE